MSKPKGPPPPIAKKPTFKDLPVPPISTKPPSLSLPIPPTINKLSSSLTDELNRKLATHLTLPTVPKKKPVVPHQTNLKSSFERSKDNDATNNITSEITSELQNVFARRNSIDANQFPKTGQGSTFTDVTKLVENQQTAQDMDSTLEMSLTDNPFDGTKSRGDDIIPAPSFGDVPTDFMNDEDLPTVLPPPDMSIFDDMSEPLTTEDGGGSDNEEIMPPDFPHDANDEIDFNNFVPPPPSDMDFNSFIPPPPPDPLLYETDEESGSEMDFQGDPITEDADFEDERDFTQTDDVQENDEFVNDVENFLEGALSGRSSRNSDNLTEEEDFLLPPPPPPMMDDDDIDSSSSSSTGADDPKSFCSESMDALTSFGTSQIGADDPKSFFSESVDAPTSFGASQIGADDPKPICSESIDFPTSFDTSQIGADDPKSIYSESVDAPTSFGTSQIGADDPKSICSVNIDVPTSFGTSQDVDAPSSFAISSHNLDDTASFVTSQKLDDSPSMSKSPEADDPIPLSTSQKIDHLESALEEKNKGKTFLVNTLNDVLKKHLSDRESSPKPSDTVTDVLNHKEVNKLRPGPSPIAIVSASEVNSDEGKTAEISTDSIEPTDENLSSSFTPTGIDGRDHRPSSSLGKTELEESKDGEEVEIGSVSLTSNRFTAAAPKGESECPPTSNPVLANKLNNVLKKQLTLSNVVPHVKKTSQSDKEDGKEQVMSGRSTPAVDDSGFNTARSAVEDSGFSTARSEDDMHSSKNNTKTHRSDELMFSALPAADAGSSPLAVSPQLSQVSRTRTVSSSTDESSTFSDDDDAPKLNLRHMLLQHMKNGGTDSEGEDENISVGFERKVSLRMDDGGHDAGGVYDNETRLNEVDVCDWKVQDVCEWLELIGFSYLTQAFSKKQIDGRVLTDHHMDILDTIQFDNPGDREIIQSEISALQMSNDEEMEMAILDALDQANFTNPDSNFHDEFRASTGTPPSLGGQRSTSSNNHVDDIPLDQNLVPCPPNSNQPINSSLNPNTSRRSSKASNRNSMNLDDLKKRLGNDVYDPSEEDWRVHDVPDHNEQVKVKKKTKKKGFFSSLRRKKGKKEEPAPSCTPDDIQTISQSNPKGMISIAYSPPNGGNEMEIKLLISSNMTSRDVALLCLDHLGLNEDVNCYFITIVSKKNKKVPGTELSSTDSPLMVQHKWNDEDDNKFELRNKVDGFITIENEDLQQDELISYKLGISARTTACDVIPVMLKIFEEKEDLKYFWLGEGDDEARVPDNTLLLDQKNNTFKLVNTSPRYLKQRKMSYNDVKKVEDKIVLLEQQVDKLSTLNEEYRRSEEHLVEENDKLNMEVKKQGDEVVHKTNDVKALQDQIISLSQKLRLSVTLGDGSVKDENDKLKQKITDLEYSLKSAEQSAKSAKESKAALEKEHEDVLSKCKKMELLIEDLKEQLDILREEKRNATSGNTEQMNKLYNENKDYLKCMRVLEDKLSETEQKLAELQMGHDVESTEEVVEMRKRLDSLDSAVLAKDTRILELEFKIQQKDRDVEDTAEQLHDQCRKTREEVEFRENAEKRCDDAVLKLDSLKSQISERDKQIQSMKVQNSKLEKKLTKQKQLLESERSQKHVEIQELSNRYQDELNAMIERVQNADKLLSESDRSMKQATFDLRKENEDLVQQNNELHKKISTKDVLIDRLESKISKSDGNVSARLQEQGQLLLVKDEKLHKAEVQIAKLESDHASKLREMANTIRLKEGLITKLEARFKKLETSSADNVKKFEKYVSEKDRLLQQVTSDHDQTFKDLRSRTRELEEMIKEKDTKLRDANRQYGEVKATADARLKKREKEYKRQKFLLEKVLKLVNDKAPSLLRQLHDSIDCENQSVDTPRSSLTSRNHVLSDEWC